MLPEDCHDIIKCFHSEKTVARKENFLKRQKLSNSVVIVVLKTLSVNSWSSSLKSLIAMHKTMVQDVVFLFPQKVDVEFLIQKTHIDTTTVPAKQY